MGCLHAKGTPTNTPNAHQKRHSAQNAGGWDSGGETSEQGANPLSPSTKKQGSVHLSPTPSRMLTDPSENSCVPRVGSHLAPRAEASDSGVCADPLGGLCAQLSFTIPGMADRGTSSHHTGAPDGTSVGALEVSERLEASGAGPGLFAAGGGGFSLGVGLYEAAPNQGGLMDQSFRPDMFRVRGSRSVNKKEKKAPQSEGPDLLDESIDGSLVAPALFTAAAVSPTLLFDKLERTEVFGVVASMIWDAYVAERGSAHLHRSAGRYVRRRAAAVSRRLLQTLSPGGANARVVEMDDVKAAIPQAVEHLLRDLADVPPPPCSDQLRGSAKVNIHQHLEQGDRGHMEDAGIFFYDPVTIFAQPPDCSSDAPEQSIDVADANNPHDVYCCVLDGHSGFDCAAWARLRLHSYLVNAAGYSSGPQGVKGALRSAFLGCDRAFFEVAKQAQCDAGSCVLTVLLRDSTLWAASVGDCRAIVCRGKPSKGGFDDGFECVNLSNPHTVKNEAEVTAIEDRGGVVTWNAGCLRVNGTLQITRSMGDRPERAVLSQEPEVITHQVDWKLDEFVVLGSDGLFEVLSRETICEFVREYKMVLEDLWDWQREMLRALQHLSEDSRAVEERGASPENRARTRGEPSVDGSARPSASEGQELAAGGVPLLFPGGDGQQDPGGSFGNGSGSAPSDWSLLDATPEAGTEDDERLTVAQRSHRRLRRIAMQQQLVRDQPHHTDRDHDDDRTQSTRQRKSLGDITICSREEYRALRGVPSEVTDCVDYQIICEALIGEAFSRKSSGKDNVVCQIMFFQPRLLTDAEIELVREIRAAGNTDHEQFAQ